jgi:hypothetical protein
VGKQATSARKSQPGKKLTDAERHKRFVAMGHEVGASDKAADFDKAFKKVAAPKRVTPNKSH